MTRKTLPTLLTKYWGPWIPVFDYRDFDIWRDIIQRRLFAGILMKPRLLFLTLLFRHLQQPRRRGIAEIGLLSSLFTHHPFQNLSTNPLALLIDLRWYRPAALGIRASPGTLGRRTRVITLLYMGSSG